MLERKILVPAAVAALGVFIIIVANLPGSGSFTFDGPLEYFFKSRDGWGMAFTVSFGVFVCLVGLAGLVRSLHRDAGADA